MNGKGDIRRPGNTKAFEENYDRIFGKKCPPHDCEFFTNPEKGACDFHEHWVNTVSEKIIKKD